MWRTKPWVLGSDQLRLHGIAACCIQVVLVTALQAAAYFAVYRQDKRLVLAPIMFWLISAASAGMGVVSLLIMRPSLFALHVVCGSAMAAASAMAQAGFQVLMLDKCSQVQLSWQGCGRCTCTLKDECTQNTLANDMFCGGCQAWGSDVCSDLRQLTPFLVALACMSLLLIGGPVVYSVLLLIRLESEQGNLVNKLQYARNLVSHEVQLASSSKSADARDEPSPVVQELLRVMIAYGTPADYSLASTCMDLYHLKMHEVLGVEPDSLLAADTQGAPGRIRSSQVLPVPVEQQLELLRKSLAGISDSDMDGDGEVLTGYGAGNHSTSQHTARVAASPRADLKLQDFDEPETNQGWNQQGDADGGRALNWSGSAGLQGPGWHADGEGAYGGQGAGGGNLKVKKKKKKGGKVKDASSLERVQVMPQLEERYPG